MSKQDHFPVDPCKTREDAYARIAQAKIGSLVNPTEEYLMMLKNELYNWLEKVDEALIKMPSNEPKDQEEEQDEQEG